MRLGERLQKAPTGDDITRLFWVLLVDDDRTLTLADVKRILEETFLGGPRWLKDRRFARLLDRAILLMADSMPAQGGEK